MCLKVAISTSLVHAGEATKAKCCTENVHVQEDVKGKEVNRKILMTLTPNKGKVLFSRQLPH